MIGGIRRDMRRCLTRWCLKHLLLEVTFFLLLCCDVVLVQILCSFLIVALIWIVCIIRPVDSLRIRLRACMIRRGIIVLFWRFYHPLSFPVIIIVELIIRCSIVLSVCLLRWKLFIWCCHLTIRPFVTNSHWLICHWWLSVVLLLLMEELDLFMGLTEIQSLGNEIEALNEGLRIHVLSWIFRCFKDYLLNLSQMSFVSTLLFFQLFFLLLTVPKI